VELSVAFERMKARSRSFAGADKQRRLSFHQIPDALQFDIGTAQQRKSRGFGEGLQRRNEDRGVVVLQIKDTLEARVVTAEQLVL
jgi:hypothetical protein